jgi:flavodoxin
VNILLIYYTGTYNTRYVSEKLKDSFLKNNNLVDLLEVNKDTKVIDLSKYDLIGLGYPIYAFNSPELFNKFLRKLKFNSKAKYFIYKNSGETLNTNNSSSRVIFHIL